MDIGTTYLRVGIFHQGQTKIITNDDTQIMTHNFVPLNQPSGSLVDPSVIVQVILDTENIMFDLKRLTGGNLCDAKVQSYSKLLHSNLMDQKNKFNVLVEAGGQKNYLDSEEITSAILTKAKEMSETGCTMVR